VPDPDFYCFAKNFLDRDGERGSEIRRCVVDLDFLLLQRLELAKYGRRERIALSLSHEL